VAKDSAVATHFPRKLSVNASHPQRAFLICSDAHDPLVQVYLPKPCDVDVDAVVTRASRISTNTVAESSCEAMAGMCGRSCAHGNESALPAEDRPEADSLLD